ncbi:MAG: type II toxin-antitoxin system RelE/ParE family toxin [Burkholderiaceae bacterium]|nr:type II toxin-antitoxin system RelE/ParE family toxin [Burkholderiaceae bacterium]
MKYSVAFTPDAREDLRRLYTYLLERAHTIEDLVLAERALSAIEMAMEIQLSASPFIFRKAPGGKGLRRELVVPFGAAGYVVLYEITEPGKVLVLAVRHQREEDYH